MNWIRPTHMLCAALWLAVTAPGHSMGAAMEPAMTLKCETAGAGADSAQAEALCTALAAVLATGDPPTEVRRVDPDTDAEMVLTVLAADAGEISARLSWARGGARGESPDMALSADDTALSPAMYPQLVAGLLRMSGWPG